MTGTQGSIPLYQPSIEVEVAANFPGPDNWNDPLQDDDSRGKFIKEIQDDFELRLKEFITTADYCAKSARIYSRLHRRWRWIIIIFTGVVVIMNLVVAYSVNNTPDSSSFGSLALNLSIAAAVAAAILAILANLENFSNPLERAHGFRESRELFVTAQRRAKNRFRTYVLALYPSPIACRNAAIMEAELAEIDRELRTKFKELTAARDTNR